MPISTAVEFDSVLSVLINSHIAQSVGWNPRPLSFSEEYLRDLAKRIILAQFTAGVLERPRTSTKTQEEWAQEIAQEMQINNLAGTTAVNFQRASRLLFPDEKFRVPNFVQQLREERRQLEQERRRSLAESMTVMDRLETEALRNTLHRQPQKSTRELRAEALKEARGRMEKELRDEEAAKAKEVEDHKAEFLRRVDFD